MTDPSIPLSPVEPVVLPPRRWVPSKVWLVPLVAALIGGSLVVQAILERGPTITVSFSTADGIEAGKTKVKYKAVDIGHVAAVHLAEDRSRVMVSIELAREAQGFAVEDSRFWVVRPRLAGSGVSGVETLLSGSYIAVDAGFSDQRADRFVGLDDPPVVAADVPGRRFILTAQDIGSLDVGSAVFFRRVPVGHVENAALDPDGHGLSVRIFVKAPYDRFVTTGARFWNASGLDLRVDASGIKLDTQSLSSILMGGVAFETPAGAADDPPAADGTRFVLANDHDEALKVQDSESYSMRLHFHQSVRGLTIGAPVDFRGVELGRVRSIDLAYDQGAGDFSPVVMVDIYPGRLTIANASPVAKDTLSGRGQKGLAELVRRGLRAQLRTGSLLTGQLYVALDFFPTADQVRFDPAARPMELPTVPSDLQELYQQAQSILRKLDRVPFDTLGQDAHRVMVALEAALRRLDTTLEHADGTLLPEVRASLVEIRASVEAMQSTVAGDAPLQQDTRQAMREMAEMVRSLRALTDSLERQPESLLRGKREQQP